MAFKIAVAGATGAVGREIIKTLYERNFPVADIVALASPRSVGQQISFGEKRILKVQNLETFDFARGNADNRLIIDLQPGSCHQCVPEISLQSLAMVQSIV